MKPILYFLLVIYCTSCLNQPKHADTNNDIIIQEDTNIALLKDDLFYINDKGKIVYSCEKSSFVAMNGIIDVKAMDKNEIQKLPEIMGFNDYFSEITDYMLLTRRTQKNIINSYYYGSLQGMDCSAMMIFKDELTALILYLLVFDDSGNLSEKYLLSTEDWSIAELNVHVYSKIEPNQDQISIYRVDTSIDEYINENNHREMIDSISMDYRIGKNDFTLIKKDSIRFFYTKGFVGD